MSRRPIARLSHLFKLGAVVVGLGVMVPSLVVGCSSDPEPKPEDTGPKRRTGPDEAWRKDKPAPGPAPTLSLPTFEKQELKNGLTVMVSHQPALPIVDVRLVVHAGSALESAKDAGLATLAYDMLDEGADGMDGAELSDAFANLGTRLRVGNDREGGGVATSVLARNLDPAVALLARVVQKPTFDKDAFEKVRGRHLSGLVAKKGNPQAQAFEAFGALAYGEKHPYGHPDDGTEATLAKIKVAAAKNWWASNAGPKNSALILVGKVTLEEGVALAEAHFAKWKSKAKRPAAPKPPPAVAGARLLFIKAPPGAPQTVMFFGRPLLEKGNADEIPAEVFNQIIGGMFSSRLNMNLREDKAWSYGAGSFLLPLQGVGPWLAGAGIKAEHTAAAVKEIVAELDRIVAEPPSAEELTLAKDNIIKSLPGQFDTVRAVGGAASSLFLYNLPLDHYATLPEKVAAVSADDVVRVAKLATAKEGLIGVLVGDAEQHLEPVKALGTFEVELLEPGQSPSR
jgi:zinc protease